MCSQFHFLFSLTLVVTLGWGAVPEAASITPPEVPVLVSKPRKLFRPIIQQSSAQEQFTTQYLADLLEQDCREEHAIKRGISEVFSVVKSRLHARPAEKLYHKCRIEALMEPHVFRDLDHLSHFYLNSSMHEAIMSGAAESKLLNGIFYSPDNLVNINEIFDRLESSFGVAPIIEYRRKYMRRIFMNDLLPLYSLYPVVDRLFVNDWEVLDKAAQMASVASPCPMPSDTLLSLLPVNLAWAISNDTHARGLFMYYLSGFIKFDEKETYNRMIKVSLVPDKVLKISYHIKSTFITVYDNVSEQESIVLIKSMKREYGACQVNASL